jgi:hypothetical protein
MTKLFRGLLVQLAVCRIYGVVYSLHNEHGRASMKRPCFAVSWGIQSQCQYSTLPKFPSLSTLG